MAAIIAARFAIGIPGDIKTFVSTAVNNIIGSGARLQREQHALTGEPGAGLAARGRDRDVADLWRAARE